MWDFMDVLCTSISRRKLRDLVIERGLLREAYQMIFSKHWKLSYFRKLSSIPLALQKEQLKKG